MIVNSWRTPVAASLALAVLIAYVVPVSALPSTKSAGKVPPSTAIPQSPDDDDDQLSGGALAVQLLLLYTGPFLYISDPPQGGKQDPSLTFQRTCSNTTKVTTERLDSAGRRIHSDVTASIDQNSRTIKLSMDKTDGAGGLTHSDWTGKADGKFYRITGYPKADELSYTHDGSKLVVTAKKAGRVKLTQQITTSVKGQSLTMSTNGVSRVFSPSGTPLEIPNMGRAPKQADGVGRLDLRVVDQDGKPVEGVRAELKSTLADDSLCESWNRTDACGVAALPPLHMGTLTLKLTAGGYATQTIPIKAADLDQPVRVVLHKQ